MQASLCWLEWLGHIGGGTQVIAEGDTGAFMEGGCRWCCCGIGGVVTTLPGEEPCAGIDGLFDPQAELDRRLRRSARGGLVDCEYASGEVERNRSRNFYFALPFSLVNDYHALWKTMTVSKTSK